MYNSAHQLRSEIITSKKWNDKTLEQLGGLAESGLGSVTIMLRFTFLFIYVVIGHSRASKSDSADPMPQFIL